MQYSCVYRRPALAAIRSTGLRNQCAGAGSNQGQQQLSNPAQEQEQPPALQQLMVKQEPAAVAA